jgi:hypothetical protein
MPVRYELCKHGKRTGSRSDRMGVPESNHSLTATRGCAWGWRRGLSLAGAAQRIGAQRIGAQFILHRRLDDDTPPTPCHHFRQSEGVPGGERQSRLFEWSSHKIPPKLSRFVPDGPQWSR